MGFWKNLTAGFRNTTSEDVWRQLFGGAPSSAGIAVNADSAMRCAAVYACVRVLAESVAQLPLPLYIRNPDGTRSKADRHSLYNILNLQPNEWQTSFEFREMLMGHVCLRGNAYAYVNRLGDGRVAELIPLHPDRVTPKQATDYTVTYDVTDPSGKSKTLRQDEVLHIRGISSDGLMGIDPIRKAMKEAIGLALATEKHGGKLFSNGTRLSGALKLAQQLSPQAQTRLRDTFEQLHAGVENAGKVAIFEQGMDWVNIGMTAEASQFLETRQYQRSEVASMFRVPLHLIAADTDKAKGWSTLEQQSSEFVTFCLLPWLKRIEQAIARDLLRADEQRYLYAEHLVDGLLRGDQKTRYEAYAIGRQQGFLSVNDIKKLENQDPIEGGDVYLVPANMVTAERMSKYGGATPVNDPATVPNPTPDPAAAA